ESSLEFRDQGRQGFRLLIRGQVTAGQPLDLEAELAQPFFGEVDLPMLERIFIAAADKERELVAVSLEEGAEVEPIALSFVIGHEARRCPGVEPTIMAVEGVVELANLGVRNLVAFGPHHPCHHFEQGEGTPQTPTRAVGQAPQDRRGEPWVGVPVREEPTIEYEDCAYLRPARGFAPLSALKPAS